MALQAPERTRHLLDHREELFSHAATTRGEFLTRFSKWNDFDQAAPISLGQETARMEQFQKISRKTALWHLEASVLQP